jgi:hypothetical protein
MERGRTFPGSEARLSRRRPAGGLGDLGTGGPAARDVVQGGAAGRGGVSSAPGSNPCGPKTGSRDLGFGQWRRSRPLSISRHAGMAAIRAGW